MTTIPRTGWRLYIDESGKFENPDDTVAVAGLLVSEDVPGIEPQPLRAALDKLVPGFLWPWHARWLNQPAWVLLAWQAAANKGAKWADRVPMELHSVVDSSLAFFRSFDARATRQALKQLEDADEPSFEDISRLTWALRDALPDQADAVDYYIRKARAAIGRVSAAIALSAERTGNRAAASLVTASEAELGDAAQNIDAPCEVVDSQRYLRLLVVLIERAVHLLDRHEGEHKLGLHVLEKDIVDPRHPDLARVLAQGKADGQPRLTVRLQSVHLVEIAREATSGTSGRVTVVPEDVGSFKGQVALRYVLADFIANQARYSMRPPWVPLSNVERQLGSLFGLPLRSGLPARTHVSASGRAWQLVHAGRAAGVSSTTADDLSGTKRWAAEAALEWARR